MRTAMNEAMTLHATLQANARSYPDRLWLRFEDATFSYADSDALTDTLAAGLLQRGITPGDRVALLFTNSPDLVFCYFACFKIGAVAVPLNTRFQVSELVYALNHSGAKILIGQADLCAPLMPQRTTLSHLEQIFVAGNPLAGTERFDDLARASVRLPP